MAMMLTQGGRGRRRVSVGAWHHPLTTRMLASFLLTSLVAGSMSSQDYTSGRERGKLFGKPHKYKKLKVWVRMHTPGLTQTHLCEHAFAFGAWTCNYVLLMYNCRLGHTECVHTALSLYFGRELPDEGDRMGQDYFGICTGIRGLAVKRGQAHHSCPA